MNTFVHPAEVIGRVTVETTNQLERAIRDLTLHPNDVPYLDRPYVVELIESTLSDGSKTQDLRIRAVEMAAIDLLANVAF